MSLSLKNGIAIFGYSDKNNEIYKMKTIDLIRNRLVDRIMLTDNEPLLKAIEGILNSTQNKDKMKLDSYQIEMLRMSENDIIQGNLISESDLQKDDSKWME